MGSVPAGDVILNDAPAVSVSDALRPESVVPKLEPGHDMYDSLSDSSPEPQASASTGPTTGKPSQDPPPPVKRKGGRKPIYATSEERKQRNRQAQAAFRERRTEYIKQLETTIQHHEEQLQNLQQSHRQAADECLMLRYKNSLLERILLEKGIDVQAELALKGSPHLRPTRPPMASQATPMHKAILNWQQGRQRPIAAPPLQTVNQTPHTGGHRNFGDSPAVQPTPPSQHSSPSTAKSPAFAIQGGMASPNSDFQPQQAQQPHQARLLPGSRHHQFASQQQSHMRSLSASTASQHTPAGRPSSHHTGGNYYPPQFQKHYDQLEQEYDAQSGMLDEVDGDDLDADNFIPNFRLPTTTAGPSVLQASPPMTTVSGSDTTGPGQGIHAIDPYDPMLDADPFGLTASMHFPNPFNFQPHQQRR